MKQEIHRKMGYGIQVEEETLKVQLEQLQGELNHPTQFKVRLGLEIILIRMSFFYIIIRVVRSGVKSNRLVNYSIFYYFIATPLL